MIARIWGIGVLLLVVGSARAQQIPAAKLTRQVWNIESGLPVNAVRDVEQTPDGFIWLATVEGLIRFDGDRFQVFDVTNTPELQTNRQNQLEVTVDGVLVVSSEEGHITIRDTQGRFREGTIDSTPIQGRIRRSMPDGTVVVQMFDGSRAAVRGAQLERLASVLPEAPVLFPFSGRQPVWGEEGEIRWVLTRDEGLFRYTQDGLVSATTSDSLSIPRVMSFTDDQDGGWWLIDEQERLLRLGGTSIEVVEDLPGITCCGMLSHTLVRAGDGSLWVVGLYGDSVGRTFRYFNGEMKAVDGDLGVATDFLVDRKGNAWIARLGGTMRNGEVLDETSATNLVEASDGSVWVSTDTGVHRYSDSSMILIGEAEGLPSENVYSIFQDRAGRVWLGLWNNPGAAVLDGAMIQMVGNTPMHTMAQLQDGRLLVGTATTLAEVRGNKLEPLLEFADFGPREPWVMRMLHEDKAGRLWIGGDNGLWILENGRLRELPGYNARTVVVAGGGLWMGSNGQGIHQIMGDSVARTLTPDDGLSSLYVRGISVDREAPDRLWVATQDGGLNRIDLDADGQLEAIRSLKSNQGLFDDGLHVVLEDAYGRLWMNTNRGVFWIWKRDANAVMDGTLPRLQFVAYTEREGLRNREGNGGMNTSGLVSADGRIWMPTQGGVAVFDPSTVSNREPVTPVLTGFAAAGGPTNVIASGRLEFKPWERDFAIYYSVPRFDGPAQARFEHRLLGYENTWRWGDTRRVSYTNLGPGQYTFEVRETTVSGSSQPASVILVLLPRWYETGWFYLVLASLFVGLPVGLLAARSRQARLREQELSALIQARTAELEEKTAALLEEKELTERQAEELLALNEAKSRLFANISHEFRTPLTLIMGPLRQMLATDADPQAESHRLMLRNTEKLLEMVTHILDLSKVESGAMRLETSPGNLSKLVGDVVRSMGPMAEQQGVKLIMGTAPPVGTPIDPDQTDKIFSNLISNAIKFTPRGGHVVVNVSVQSGQAAVEVRDTGAGIPPEHIDRIFDRFYQVDDSVTRRHDGTGIGLALVRELSQLHGGSVSVTSEVGHGSVFTVLLPLVALQEALGTPGEPGFASGLNGALSESAEIEADESDQTKVLVVDDNHEIRQFIRSILEPEFRIIEAEDGQEALDRVKKDAPDLLVTDVMMPRMDGFELNRRLKSEPDTDCIPVIFLTALADDQYRLEGLLTDADHYLTKPLDGSILLEQVRSTLRQRHRLKDRSQTRVWGMPTAAQSALERRVREFVQERIAESDLSASRIADAVALSHSQLNRRLKADTGMSISELVRDIRVGAAAEMLLGREGNISEIAYAVGFNSLSYFNRSFREKYGSSPSEFVRAAVE